MNMFRTFTNQSLQIKAIRSIPFRQWHKEVIIPVTWKRPEMGWTKLNFDGSSKGKAPGKASIGGVLRDHNAQFLLGYAEPIGRANSSIAELTALRKGLELVLENGCSDVWFEGDSKALVEIIAAEREVKCVETRSQIRYVKSMTMELNSFMVTHIYREGNRVANWFASMGHQYRKPQIWKDIPPMEASVMLSQDADGLTFLRKR